MSKGKCEKCGLHAVNKSLRDNNIIKIFYIFSAYIFTNDINCNVETRYEVQPGVNTERCEDDVNYSFRFFYQDSNSCLWNFLSLHSVS